MTSPEALFLSAVPLALWAVFVLGTVEIPYFMFTVTSGPLLVVVGLDLLLAASRGVAMGVMAIVRRCKGEKVATYGDVVKQLHLTDLPPVPESVLRAAVVAHGPQVVHDFLCLNSNAVTNLLNIKEANADAFNELGRCADRCLRADPADPAASAEAIDYAAKALRAMVPKQQVTQVDDVQASERPPLTQQVRPRRFG